MTDFAVAAQKSPGREATASCPPGRQLRKAKPSSSAAPPEPSSTVRAAAKLPPGLSGKEVTKRTEAGKPRGLSGPAGYETLASVGCRSRS